VIILLPLAVLLGWLVDVPAAGAWAQPAELRQRPVTRFAPAPGSLELTAAPTKATPDRAISVRVANTGGDTITGVAIWLDVPPGVTATAKPDRPADLVPGASTFTTVTATGVPQSRPATLVVKATGRSGSADVTAQTLIELVRTEPVPTLTLTGNNRLTDSSATDLVAVIDNATDTTATVVVRATAGQHVVRLVAQGGDVTAAKPGGSVTLTMEPRRSAVVLIEVRAQRPLRRGTTAVVVTASVTAPQDAAPVDVSAVRSLDVALSADLLPGLLGVGSILVVPGLVTIWAALTVLGRDRRRIGLAAPDAASRIWENKLWMLAAAAVSLVAAALYAALGFANLLDTYTLSDVAIVTVAAGLLGAAAAGAAVWRHRRGTPAVTPGSPPLAVLDAAARAEDTMARPVYRTTDGKLGLLVQHDRDAVVLTPQIEYTEIDGLDDQAQLKSAIARIPKTADAEHRMRFRADSNGLDGPRAHVGALPAAEPHRPILKYVDAF